MKCVHRQHMELNYFLWINLIRKVVMITRGSIKLKLITLTVFLAVTCGFTLPPAGHIRRCIKMIVVDDNYPGQAFPTGFFDPLGLSSSVGGKQLKLWREAELKHGRLSMLGALGIVVQENFHPLFGGKIAGPAINHFQQVNEVWPNFWLVMLFSISLIETYTIVKGWEDPGEAKGNVAMLKDDFIPGDLGFDPLNFLTDRPKSWNNGVLNPQFANLRTKELNNGRLAMIGVTGMIVQELLDGLQIFQHIGLYGLKSSL